MFNFNSIHSLFTGKGGTLRVAMILVTLLGLAGAISENGYSLEADLPDGKHFSFKPAPNSSAGNESQEAASTLSTKTEKALEESGPVKQPEN